MTLEDLIESWKEIIKSAEDRGDNLDAADWDWQDGILISCNEAKKIIEALEKNSINLNP